jgi:HlyD family secretion protein
LVVLIVFGVLLYRQFFLIKTAQNSQTSTTPQFYTSPVRTGNIQVAATGSGSLVAGNSINLSFTTSGVVGTLNVQVGDSVKTGQVLAQLNDLNQIQADIASQQLALLQAQQELQSFQAGANVALAQAYKTYIDDQTAYQTALLTEQRTAYARCSKPTNTQLQAKFDQATQNLNTLTVKDPGSDAWINAKNVYDQSLANLQYCLGYTQDEKTQDQASLDVAKQQLDQSLQTYTTLRKNNGIDPNQLDLAQTKVKQAQIALDLSKQKLSGATITAPINGTVISIAANQGQTVDTSTFITLADTSKTYVQVQVAETDLSKMKIGNPIQIVFDALPDKTYTGKLIQIDPALVTSGQNQIAQGLAAMDNAVTMNGQMLPLGVSGTVTVIAQQAKNVLIVPAEALRDLGGGEYAVFVEGQNQELQMQPVQIGIQDGTNVEIKSGLSAGQRVSTGSTEVNNIANNSQN